MKKILALLLCLVMSFSLLSCEGIVMLEESEFNTEQTTTLANQEENKTPAIDDSLWKSAYLDLVESRHEQYSFYDIYALVYIDDDDIPELFIEGVDAAHGDMVFSYQNGEILDLHLSRNLGGKYIERSGKIINRNGHMGYYYDCVYLFDDNGFSQTFNGTRTEYDENMYADGVYNPICDYYINGESVSETEYNDALNAAFDLSKSVSFYDKSVSYDEIKQQLS